VASIAEKPVYCISEVAMLPLASQVDAEKAIIKARDSQLRYANSSEETMTDVSDDEDIISLADEEHVVADPDPEPAPVDQTPKEGMTTPSTVSQQTAARSVLFGRFAERWMSIRGAAPRVRTTAVQDPTTESANTSQNGLDAHNPDLLQPDYTQTPISNARTVTDDTTVDFVPLESETKQVPAPISKLEKVPMSLIPKLLRTSRFLFGSKNFFFSYDHDISRRVSDDANQQDTLELYESFDRSVSSR
jgi:hypothetical protein